MQVVPSQYTEQLQALKVPIVDDEAAMRKVTKSLLQAIGVATIHEARNGREGIDTLCRHAPDAVILDWSMPGVNGPEFVREVRSPDSFPYPAVPIIMLTAHGDRSHVVEAVRLGVNEFLLKPVSSTALRTRQVSILANPRVMVEKGGRKMSSYRPENDPALSDVLSDVVMI